MTGGIIELVAKGHHDILLTDNPEITFFKIVYKRHTNFSIESIKQKFSNKLNFGGKASCVLSKVGDLVGDLALIVVLPKISSNQNNKEGCDKFKNFAWVKKIGFALIKSIYIDIGGQKIDEHYGDWMNIWYELTGNKDRGFNKLIGNIKELTDFSETKDSYTLYIPIKFWFCGNSGLAIPIVNLQYSQVKITVELNEVESLYITTPTHYIKTYDDICNFEQFEYITQTIDGAESIGIFIGFDINEKKLYYTKISTNTFKGIPNPFNKNDKEIIETNTNKYKIIGFTSKFEINPDIKGNEIIVSDFIGNLNLNDCYLLVDYIYLDGDERRKFVLTSHEYIIDYVKLAVNKNISSNYFSENLLLNNPCIELFWIFQLKYLNNTKFSSKKSQYFDKFNYTNNYKYVNDKLIGSNNILKTKLLLNGTDRFQERNGDYFNMTQTYQNHRNSDFVGINTYSFSLFPDDIQPSGTCNMSKIDQISMDFFVNKDISYINNGLLRVYSKHINILKISNGLGALAFVP